MEILALSLGDIFGNWIWPILEFVIGLGLVVFVHELGHFLAAKAVGIRVEKFAIGMGWRVWGFKRGETEYCLNLLPLGGYLKMTGQDDFRPVETAGGPAAAPDPRAFESKSIRARLLVLSAGVAMNIVFGAILFIIVGMVGKPFPAPVVGRVSCGSPAALADLSWQTPPPAPPSTSPAFPDGNIGLRPGDGITRIDGERFLMKLINRDVSQFAKLSMIALLSNPDDRYTLTFQRQIAGKTYVGTARLGVRATVADMGNTRYDFGLDAAHDANMAGADDIVSKGRGLFHPGDRVIAIGGKKVSGEWEIAEVQRRLDGNAVAVTVLRDGKETDLSVLPALEFEQEAALYYLKDGTRLLGSPLPETDDIVLTQPDGRRRVFKKSDVAGGNTRERLDILGMIPRLTLEAVLDGTAAQKAGLQPGDIIYEYGDIRGPTRQQLNEASRKAADGGTSIVVLRGDKLMDPIWIVPKRQGEDNAVLGFAPGADVAHPVIAGIRAGSPAAKTDLQSGDVIEKINDRPVRCWLDLFNAVKALDGGKAVVHVTRGSQSVSADLGAVTPEVFRPEDYGFSLFDPAIPFNGLRVTIVKRNPLGAMAWGLDQTWEFVISAYATLRQLIAGTLSAKEASGPVGIAHIAVMVGRQGFIQLVYLMAILSATVAVFNFLPFPVLDGGHAALLGIEKIRGKPLPAKVTWGIQLFGLICLAALFILLTWNDINRLIHG